MQPYMCSLAPQMPSREELVQKAKTFVASQNQRRHSRHTEMIGTTFNPGPAHNLPSLPSTPETISLYISDQPSTHTVSTITSRLTSITKAHQAAGFANSPASTRHFIVGETLKGIRRVLGTKQHGKYPLLSDDIRRIIASSPEGMLGLRDDALVLIGFAGAFRRSELAQIHSSDLSFSDDGVVIDLRVSKTGQEGAGRKVGIPFARVIETCPVRALRTWLVAAKITEGPVFRRVDRYGYPSRSGLHKDSIGKLLKRAAARAQMNIRSECIRP
jgi:integrase